MKSSIHVFASLVAALAMFSQPAIATYIQADLQVNINSDAISTGIKNRKDLLESSQEKPGINDQIVTDSYKEVFSKSGKLQEAKIVLYNTSFAPASIEVFSSDGKFKSVEFIDGAKAGFKDFGDYIKSASAGLIETSQCTTNLWKCLGDPRYGIEKNERTIKIESGDVIRISRGSDAAFAYTIASSNIGLLELLASIPGITPSKVTSPSLLKNYSQEQKRKAIEKFVIKKMKGKYTWKMIFEQLGYETYKKSASNPQGLLNNTLEIVQNVPKDFWENMTDGTVAATAAGDVVDTLVQAVSAKASIALNSSLFISQSVNITAMYKASEFAYKKPFHIIVAGLKDSPTNSNQPVATKQGNRSPLSGEAVKNTKQVNIGNIKKLDISGPGCWYWRAGENGKNKEVLSTWGSSGGGAVMNLNGSDTKLKEVDPWKSYSLGNIKIQVKTKIHIIPGSESKQKGTIVVTNAGRLQTIKVEGYCGE